MKKLVVGAIAALALIIGFAVWFWSLGSIPEDAAPLVTLRVAAASVEVRAPNGSVWVPAKDGMTIGEGWSVKTDANGRATIAVADLGETRMDTDSELTVSKASLEAFGSNADVEFMLAVGRAWTRVLRFFDLGSTYAVKTSSVVATVRGTAFEVSVGANKSATVSGIHAAVDVRPVGGFVATTTDPIAAGVAASYDGVGRSIERRAMTSAERSAPWFNGNLLDDRSFAERALAARTANLRTLGGAAPGTFVAGVALLSERVHLAFAGESERARLRERYFERRLMQIVDLAGSGKSGQAAQEFARLDNEARSSTMSVEDRMRLGRALAAVAPVVDAAPSDAPLAVFRQRVASLAQSVSDPASPPGVYAHLIAIEDQIVDAERFVEARQLKDARVALDGASSGIANVERESSATIIGFSKEDRGDIEAKLSTLRARVTAARFAIDVIAAEQIGAATSTDALTDGEDAPSTEPPPSGEATSTPSEPAEAAVISSIRLAVAPSTLDIGKKGAMRIIATLTDGSTADVSGTTALAASDERIVHLNGLEIVGLAQGKAAVTATYTTASGKVLTSVAEVEVRTPTQPTSLGLTASNGTSLVTGQSTAITATVRRSDGTEGNVTNDTVFLLDANSVGEMNGNVYSSQTPGKATVTATYTENGKTVTSSLVITVTAPLTNQLKVVAPIAAPIVAPVAAPIGATATR